MSTQYRVRIYNDVFEDKVFFDIRKREKGESFRAKLVWEKYDESIIRANDEDFTLVVHSGDRQGEVFLNSLVQQLHLAGALKADPNSLKVQGELEATKKHLEDMRKIALQEL